jgi:hypothetical protein
MIVEYICSLQFISSTYYQSWACATFFESAIAIPQLEESTSAIAIPQLFKAMLIRYRNSAIPQSQFFLKSATSSPQLECFIYCNFQHIFGREVARNYIFFTTRCFLLLRVFKGTVARDFRPLKFV